MQDGGILDLVVIAQQQNFADDFAGFVLGIRKGQDAGAGLPRQHAVWHHTQVVARFNVDDGTAQVDAVIGPLATDVGEMPFAAHPVQAHDRHQTGYQIGTPLVGFGGKPALMGIFCLSDRYQQIGIAHHL